jgi:hypothetical protein
MLDMFPYPSFPPSSPVIPAKAGTQGWGSITIGKTIWNRY